MADQAGEELRALEDDLPQVARDLADHRQQEVGVLPSSRAILRMVASDGGGTTSRSILLR